MRFEDVHWHDGQIHDWRIRSSDDLSKTGAVEFTMAVFKDLQTPERFRITVLFEDVERLSLTCNFPDLADNFLAGNIDWAAKEGERTYRFDLFGDNSFELVTDKVSIRREG